MKTIVSSLGLLSLAVLLSGPFAVAADKPAPVAPPNYDESKIPAYTLPDPLVMADGTKVTDAETWRTKRRPEILKLFETHMFGRTVAPRPEKMTFEVIESDDNALGGKAIRKQVRVKFTGTDDGPRMDLLIYAPKSAASKPAPAFVSLNFQGNHATTTDPAVRLAAVYDRSSGKVKPAEEKSRGAAKSRWPFEMIVERGYAVATAYYGDIDPDFNDFSNGIHPVYYKDGQTRPAADEWMSIGAWAWGLSRALDYLQTDKLVDAKKVAVMGHSRLGKTSLWAGAQDERFAIVISNNSGCGGAALSRRVIGESVARINTSFPHWFCDNFKKYNAREGELPLDQHMLIALAAPRPVYVASAEQDKWADPKGEYLSAYHAGPVYRLLGKQALESEQMPEVNTPVMTTVGYHIRTGKHDVTDFDWQRYMDFADKHLGKP